MAAVVIGIKGGLDTYKSMTLFGVDKKIDVLEMNAGSTSAFAKATAKFLKMNGCRSDESALSQSIYRIWAGNDPQSHKNDTMEAQFGDWTHRARVAAEYERLTERYAYGLIFVVLSLIIPLFEILTEMEYTPPDTVLPLNIACQAVFTLDASMRLFTYIERPPKAKATAKWGYLIFGSILTIVLWIPTHAHDLIPSCHMLRLVTGLQFLSWIKDLELIMTAFTVSCYGIYLLGVLVAIAFLFFSIAAVMLFKETDPFRFGSIPSR